MFRLKFFQLLTFFVLAILCFADEDRYLFLPVPEKCKNRFHEAEYEGTNFFYSGNDPELKDLKVDWLDARNTCRERCMETVTFDVEKKFDFFKKYIAKNNISFIWTSGRLCDFAGCEGRWDLLPKIIKAWLWTGNQVQLKPTNVKPKDWSYQPWSHTGHRKLPQPDDAEFFVNQVHESCLAILNNMYNDSVAFHDVACHHKTRFICEDSEPLLEQAKMIELEEKEGKKEEKVEKIQTTTEKVEKKETILTTRKKSNRRKVVTTTDAPVKIEDPQDEILITENDETTTQIPDY